MKVSSKGPWLTRRRIKIEIEVKIQNHAAKCSNDATRRPHPPPGMSEEGKVVAQPVVPADPEGMAAMLKAQAAMLAQMQAQLEQVKAAQELGASKPQLQDRERTELRTETDRRDDVRLRAVRCHLVVTWLSPIACEHDHPPAAIARQWVHYAELVKPGEITEEEEKVFMDEVHTTRAHPHTHTHTHTHTHA